MQYRGIEYDIRVGIGRNEWVWVIHTRKPRQGKSIGSRNTAVFHAEKAIDTWCTRFPEQCTPRPPVAARLSA
jgi:hypothetical protein